MEANISLHYVCLESKSQLGDCDMQDTSASAQCDIYLRQSMNRLQNTQQVPMHKQAATDQEK